MNASGRPPSRAWASRAAELIAELTELGPRVQVTMVPNDWTPDQARRLAQCINKVLEVGEPGLRRIEDTLRG